MFLAASFLDASLRKLFNISSTLEATAEAMASSKNFFRASAPWESLPLSRR
jgi:hypothetical protein